MDGATDLEREAEGKPARAREARDAPAVLRKSRRPLSVPTLILLVVTDTKHSLCPDLAASLYTVCFYRFPPNYAGPKVYARESNDSATSDYF
jgi:hypothetical protein